MQSYVGSAYYAVHVGAAQVVIAREGAAVSEQSYLMACPPSLAMCPQRLVNRDGDVSGTKDRDGIDPRDLLSLSPVLLESQVLLYSFGVIPALVEIRNSDGKVYYPCHM